MNSIMMRMPSGRRPEEPAFKPAPHMCVPAPVLLQPVFEYLATAPAA